MDESALDRARNGHLIEGVDYTRIIDKAQTGSELLNVEILIMSLIDQNIRLQADVETAWGAADYYAGDQVYRASFLDRQQKAEAMIKAYKHLRILEQDHSSFGRSMDERAEAARKVIEAYKILDAALTAYDKAVKPDA